MPAAIAKSLKNLIGPLAPLMDHMPVVIYDRKGIIQYSNKIIEEDSGYSDKELRGKSIFWLFLPGIRVAPMEFRKKLQTRQSFGADVILRFKHTARNTYQATHTESKEGRSYVAYGNQLDVNYTLMFCRPVFDWIARQMGDLSSDAMVTIDIKGRIISFSEMFKWMAGDKSGKIFGHPLSGFLRKGSVNYARLHEAKAYKDLVALAEDNKNPWEPLFDRSLSLDAFGKDWIFEKNTRISMSGAALVVDCAAPDSFLIFKKVIDHFHYDVRWTMLVSFRETVSANFFFDGTTDFNDANICTPDIEGYLLGLHRRPNEEGKYTAHLKRWCKTMISTHLKIKAKGEKILLKGEKLGGVFRLFVNNRQILEYADPNFIRYSLSYHTGLVLGGFPVHIHSLRLEQRKSISNYALYEPQSFDIVFNNKPTQVFEAELFYRQLYRRKMIDIYLRRVTDLRKAQAELKTMLMQKEQSLVLINLELKMASSVLNRLLPQNFPEIPGTTFASYYQPSGHVGGDLYDVFKTASGKIAILLYDVSGHGVPAALVSVMFKTLFQKYFDEKQPLLSQLSLINAELYSIVGEPGLGLDNPMFVTLFYGLYDPETMNLSYVGAGTPAPMVFQREGLTLLHTRGLPLGMDSMLNLKEQQITLGPAAKVIMFTDGLFEIFNDQGALYGIQRMVDFINAHKHLPLKQLFKVIVAEQKEYAGTTELRDDVSMLGMELVKN